MKTVPNRATAEGLPSLTRRLFLRGAAVIAPLAALPVLAASASDYAEENPALLDAEPALDAAEAEMIAATAAYEEAVRAGERVWPRAPEEITYPRPWGDNIERNIQGRGYEDGPGVETSTDLSDELKRLMRKRKVTPDVEEARNRTRIKLAAAEAYEAACENARAVSGIAQANARQDAAAKALTAAVHTVHREPAKTMAGVRIKAKAVCAWNRSAPRFDKLLLVDGKETWAPDLAASILGILDV